MSEQPTAVEALVLEYLQQAESGMPPDVEALADRLPTEEQRQELRELGAAAAAVEHTLPDAWRSGRTVAGRYQLREELGAGSYGKVFRAYDQHNGRDVALKVFHALRDERRLKADLDRERAALSSLKHPGIVRLLDHGQHEDTIFLALEYERGRSLERILLQLDQDGAYPPPHEAVLAALQGAVGSRSLAEADWQRTAARILVELLSALEAAHTHEPRILHRDLKPSNVLLRPDGSPVLLDFGLAGIGEGEGDVTAKLFGSAPYMAPEQLRSGKTGKGEASDIYQAGLLLYELLTLRRAFPGETRTEVLDKVQRGQFAPPSAIRREIPPELEDVCLRALEFHPNRRYPDVAAFRTDLERWLDGLLPMASRFGPLGRAVRQTRKALWRHRVAAALVLCIGGGFVVGQTILRSGVIAARVLDDRHVAVQIETPSTYMEFWRWRIADGYRRASTGLRSCRWPGPPCPGTPSSTSSR